MTDTPRGPDYSVHDPKGWCGDPSRGAALGRPTVIPDHPLHAVQTQVQLDKKLHLRRIRLNAGGYDRNGTYFGVGAPLYWCVSDDNEIDFMVRGGTRRVAKAGARAILAAHGYTNVRFYQ